MPRRRLASAGFTLIELLLVVAIIGILVAIVLPSSQPAVYDQLRSTAEIVSSHLAYVRSLAVSNNSKYTITFDLTANRFLLKHSGANTALAKLPKTPFATSNDTTDQQILDLDDIPHVGPTVRLAAAATTGTAVETAASVEFGPLGQTTNADPTTIWLVAGSGENKKYITIVVNPVTGLTELGDYTSAGPPSAITQVTD